MAVQISGAQIKDDAISEDKISTGAVVAGKIASSAVTTAKINSLAITSGKIANSAITTNKLNTAAVTAAKADLSGTWDFSSGTIRVPSTPTDDNDAVCKSYLDGIVGGGVYWKEPCVAASTANIDLSNPGTDSFDDVTLTSGDRILVKDQTTASQNGVYDFNGSTSALTRSSDSNVASELNGLAVFVKQGTENADQGFIQTAEISNLGSDNVTFVQFTGLGQITAGEGLTKSGNTISASVGDGLTIEDDEIQISYGDGVTSAEGSLTLDVDDTTVELSGGVLQVISGGITATQLASSAVTTAKIASSAISTAKIADDAISTAKIAAAAVGTTELGSLSVSTAKIAAEAVDENKLASSVAGSGLSGGAGSALSIDVDDSTIEIGASGLNVKALGIDSAQIAVGAVTVNKIFAGSVTAAKLGSNVAGDGIALNASTNAIDVSVGDGLTIDDGDVAVSYTSGITSSEGSLTLDVDDTTVELSSGVLQVADGGITATQLGTSACTTAKINDAAVTIAKAGFKFYQELTSVSGSSVNGIELSVGLTTAAMTGVLAFKNGLAMMNKTALGGSASDADEFTVANDGSGSVGKLTFGANLTDGDKILIHFWNDV